MTVGEVTCEKKMGGYRAPPYNDREGAVLPPSAESEGRTPAFTPDKGMVVKLRLKFYRLKHLGFH